MKDIEEQVRAYAEAITSPGADDVAPGPAYLGGAHAARSFSRGWFAAAASVAVLFLVGGLLVVRSEGSADPTLASTTTTTDEDGVALDVASTTTESTTSTVISGSGRQARSGTSTTPGDLGPDEAPQSSPSTESTTTTVGPTRPPGVPDDAVPYVLGMLGFKTSPQFDSDVIPIGGEIHGELVVNNSLGTPVWYEACGDLFTVVISQVLVTPDDYTPRMVPLSELAPCDKHIVVIPVGESRWPAVVRAIPYRCATLLPYRDTADNRDGMTQSRCEPEPDAGAIRPAASSAYILTEGPWYYPEWSFGVGCHPYADSSEIFPDGLPGCWGA